MAKGVQITPANAVMQSRNHAVAQSRIAAMQLCSFATRQ